MTDRVVLGIHSYADPATEGSFNQLIDGHAWISVTRSGVTEVYGLWPDDHPTRDLDNGAGTDIRHGLESGYPPTASRYYELTPEQATRLEARLRENVTWGYTNTCASWASETVSRVTGQDLDAGELLGLTDTPRQLIESIRKLERQRDTSPANPIAPSEIRRSSSLGALDQADPLVGQATAAVRAEHQRLGLPTDDLFGEVAFAVRLARENDLHGIANIRYPETPDGNVFVRGTGTDPGARALASYRDFTQTPVEASLAAIDAQREAVARQAVVAGLESDRLVPRVQGA